MIVLGIVGTPAGGKSTVARHLEELGATWINADLVARAVLERDDVQATLIAHFGSEITGKAGLIDRNQLALRVFGDDDANRRALLYLESVVHPPTRREITLRLQAAATQGVIAATLDVPLLFESQWDRSCDEVWCIDSSSESRLRRSASRGWDDAELRRRESSQININEKKRLSNHVIMNDSSIEDLHNVVAHHWNRLVQNRSHQTTDSHCITDLPRS